MRILRNMVLVNPLDGEFTKTGLLLPQGNLSYAPINQIPNIGTVVVAPDKYVDPLGHELKVIKRTGHSSDGRKQEYRPDDEKFVVSMDITVKPGDKIWFHRNAIRQAVNNNDYILHENKKCYWMSVTDIFCYERGGVKYAHGPYCILVPIWELEEDITHSSGLMLKSRPQRDSMKAVVYLTTEEIPAGEVVMFNSKGAATPIEFHMDGFFYYRCMNRELLATCGYMGLDAALDRQKNSEMYSKKMDAFIEAFRMLEIKNPTIKMDKPKIFTTHNDYNNERWH